MKITLVGFTYANRTALKTMDPGFFESGVDHLAEFAGRACYQSFHRPNPATAGNEDYLANIIKQQHFSVLEHGSASFYVEGVSRALTHELIRHRHLSFSQLSQRFVALDSDAGPVMPPNAGDTAQWMINQAWGDAVRHYRNLSEHLETLGTLTLKEKREIARAVLPNCAPTSIVVTGNHRAWREFLVKRNNPHADAEIQELARELLVLLSDLAPATYKDMTS